MALSDDDYLIIPAQPLVAGTSYLLRDDNMCFGSAGPSAIFTAGPAVPLPTAPLGTLHAVERDVAELEVSTSGGSCSSMIQADQATIDLELDPAVAPWLPVLHFETLVDGQPWHRQTRLNVRGAPGASWRGRGVDLVYELCRSDDPWARTGLTSGRHLVAMRATLPGTAIIMETAPAAIELACPGDPPPTCIDSPEPCDGSRAGCSAGGSHPAPWLVLAFGALGGLLVRRRR
jgi:MYXO-CTERM domain-containing protein